MDNCPLAPSLSEIQRSLGNIEGTLASMLADARLREAAVAAVEDRVTTLENLKFKLMGGAAVLATLVTTAISLFVAYVSGLFHHR